MTTATELLLDTIADTFADVEPLYGNEYDLQEQLGSMLAAASISHEREYRLDAFDRPDFWIPTGRVLGIVVEVKVKGTAGTVAHQLRRYLQHDVVEAAILVTTDGHRQLVPRLLTPSKPFRLVDLSVKGL